MTTAGKMHFYGAPSGSGELRQIAAGPRRSMWFTSFLNSGIGRIATR